MQKQKVYLLSLRLNISNHFTTLYNLQNLKNRQAKARLF